MTKSQWLAFCLTALFLVVLAVLAIERNAEQYRSKKQEAEKWAQKLDKGECETVGFVSNSAGKPVTAIYKCGNQLKIGPLLDMHK